MLKTYQPKPPPSAAPEPYRFSPSAPEAWASGRFPIFRMIVDQKIEAYEIYNELAFGPAHDLFIANLQHHFARQALPRDQTAQNAFLAAYHNELHRFTLALYQRCEAVARTNGNRVIREPDAMKAVQAMTPFTVNDYEDVTFYPRFDREDRTTLAGYDLDAFRDYGLHWHLLRDLIGRTDPPVELEPDPFAAELLAEAVAQYGVLALRLAGAEASRSDRVEMGLPDLAAAAAAIAAQADRHASRPERTETSPPIESAGGSSGPAPGSYFTDITESSGIDFAHRCADWLNRRRRAIISEQNEVELDVQGAGLAAADLNGDHAPEVLLLSGGGHKLYLNDGHGRFTDITASAGLNQPRPDGSLGEPRQVLIADFDNDGIQDLFITFVDDNHRLFRGLDGMRFREVSREAGLVEGKGLSGGPALTFDYDNDGLLDIYVTYYGNFMKGDRPRLGREALKDVNTQAPPNRLYRNRGNFRFEDVTDATGSGDTRWATGASHTDLDGDGFQDIVLANDYGFNTFLLNENGARFSNRVQQLEADIFGHGMCVSVADLNQDRLPDVYITNIGKVLKDEKYVRPNTRTHMKFNIHAMQNLRVREADTLYMSVAEDARLRRYTPSLDVARSADSTAWAWGSCFLDCDHDGDDDIYVVNGSNPILDWGRIFHDLEFVQNIRSVYMLNMANVLFINEAGQLKNRARRNGAGLEANSRSVVQLDADGDGDRDLLLNNYESSARLLRNNAETRELHWIKLKLIGDPARGSNRDAIGARVIATTPGGRGLWREIHGGTGYLSMDPKIVHLGLGEEDAVSLTIRWPNGEEQTVEDLKAGRLHTIAQATDTK
ncbi:MAG: CRTAC1 family protein [Verrucomicrobiota bacterium]